MQNRQHIITYGYHFLCEALLLFFICLPVMHYYYASVPYKSYPIYSLAICLVFSLLTKYGNRYWHYIAAAPFIMLAFYAGNYPALLCIVIPIILTWRYINIRGEYFISRENMYIRITLVLAVALYLLIGNGAIILYAFLQFIVLFFGYIISQLLGLEKRERKPFAVKLWIIISGVFALCTIIVFMLFDTGRYIFLKMGEMISYLAAFLVEKLSFLFAWMDFKSLPNLFQSSPMEKQSNQQSMFEQTNPSTAEMVMPYVYAGIIFIISIILIVIVIRVMKKKFTAIRQQDITDAISYNRMDNADKGKQKLKNIIAAKFFSKPRDPVRKMVYQFERSAAMHNCGRYPFETIEDWLVRIQADIDMTVYQRVRYGNQTVASTELAAFKQQLEQAKSYVENERRLNDGENK